MSSNLVAAAVAVVGVLGEHPIRQSLVDTLHSMNLGMGWHVWEPEENPLRWLSEAQIKGLMGTHGLTPLAVAGNLQAADVPSAFDARQQWPRCQKPIRNQLNCGSCWAFGAAETLTDNLCILGTNPPVLSPQDLVACDSSDFGCHGGNLLNAWAFIDNEGLVSDSCMPYISGDGTTNGTCADGPVCTDYGTATRYRCPVQHTMLESDVDIQRAVMTVGAVEVGFTVFEDFMNYKSGIYKYSGQGIPLGGHAVKIVGWGHDYSAGFYWIVQNSWGPSWGEEGYFRIVNWHADKDSAIAIGGGMACLSGDEPAPPSPPPTPVACSDIVSYCGDYSGQCGEKTYLIPVCQKTCGCCGAAVTPSYCSGAVAV